MADEVISIAAANKQLQGDTLESINTANNNLPGATATLVTQPTSVPQSTKQSTFDPNTGIATTIGPSDQTTQEQVETIPTPPASFISKVYDTFKKGAGWVADKAIQGLTGGGTQTSPDFWGSSYEESQRRVDHPEQVARKKGNSSMSDFFGDPVAEKQADIEERSKAFYSHTPDFPEEHQPARPSMVDILKSSIDAESVTTNLKGMPTQGTYMGVSGFGLDKSLVDRAEQLGLTLERGEDGKYTVRQTSLPTIKPEELSGIGNSVKTGFDYKINQKLGELSDIKSEMTKTLREAGSTGKPELFTKTQQDQSAQYQAKTAELEKLQKQKSEAAQLYASFYSTMKSRGYQPDFQIATKLMTDSPDIKGTTEELKQDSENRTKFLGAGMETYHMLNGADVLNYGNVSDQISSKYEVLHQQSHIGDILAKSTTPETLQRYAFTSATSDISSIQETIDRDNKILKNLNEEMTAIRADATKKGIPGDQTEAFIDKSGLRELSFALQDNIATRNKEVEYDKTLIATKMPDYKRYEAAKQLSNEAYARSPVSYALGNDLSTALPRLRDGLATFDAIHNRFISPTEKTTIIYRAAKDLDINKIEPEFTDKDGFIRKLSEKEAFVFGDKAHPLVPTDFNGSAVVYNTARMTTDMIPWIATGAFMEKNIVSPGFSSLLKYLKEGEEVKGLEGLATGIGGTVEGTPTLANKLFKAGRITTEVAKPIVGAHLEYVLPGMMTMTSPDAIENEMQKGLNFEQAVQTTQLRTYWESLAFAVAPGQMNAVKGAFIRGDIKNLAEHEVYENLIRTNWERFTGKSITDGLYNFIFNPAKSIGKQYLETVGLVSVQQDLALGANALTDMYLQGHVNSAYQSEYDVTSKRLLDNTLTAMATMLPLSLLHGYKGAQQVRDAQYSSLYTVAEAPEQYSSHIKFRLDNSEIDNTEAIRQVAIIKDAETIHAGLKSDYDEIDRNSNLDNNQKDKLKFELFKNGVDAAGVTSSIAELNKVTRNAKEDEAVEKKLEDLSGYLLDNAKRYEDIKAYVEFMRKLSPAERERVIINRKLSTLSKEYSSFGIDLKDPAGEGLLMGPNKVELAKQLLASWKDRLDAETDPRIQEVYRKVIERVDLALAHTEFHNSQDGTRIMDHVRNLADFIEQHPDAKEAKEKMDSNQKFILDNYGALLHAELEKRGSTVEPPTPEPPKEKPKADTVSTEKERINTISDIDLLQKERSEVMKKFKDLPREDRREIYNHIGRRIEELTVQANQVAFGSKTYQKGDFVRVSGDDSIYRVQGLTEDGRLILRIGKSDEDLDTATKEINERRATELAKAAEEQKPEINERFDKEITATKAKTETHVTDPESISTVTDEEKNKYFDALSRKAAAKKTADNLSVPAESRKAASMAIAHAIDEKLLEKNNLTKEDINIAIRALEESLAAKEDLISFLDKSIFERLLDTSTYKALKAALSSEPAATVAQLKKVYDAYEPVKEEPIYSLEIPSTDLNTMTREDLEKEHLSNDQLIRDVLFRPDEVGMEDYEKLVTRQKAVQNLLEIKGPETGESLKEQQQKKEDVAKKETEVRTSRVFHPLSTAPQQSTGKGVATEDIVTAQVATFEALKKKQQDSGKSYADLGYHATVMSNTLPIDSRHQKQDVIDDHASGKLSKDRIKQGRIVVITDTNGAPIYFDKEGNRTSEDQGFPVYQNLRGTISGGELILQSEPSKADLEKSGELESYNKDRELLKTLKLSTEPVTFSIKEITSGFISVKPEFVPIVLGPTITFSVKGKHTKLGQLAVYDSSTGVEMAAKASPALSESTIKDDILAILDMGNKVGLPDKMKDSFTDRRNYVEKFLFTHGNGVYGSSNRLRLGKDGKTIREDGKPIEEMILNYDSTLFGKDITYYKWDGEKFISEKVPYNSYIAANYKVYQPVVSAVNSYIKLGDQVAAEKKTSSDLEAKKADIERRRQEEFSNVKIPTNSELFKVGNTINYNGEKATITDNKLGIIKSNVGILNVDGRDEDNYLLYQNGKQEALDKQKEINAKYDAELAALESKKEIKSEVIKTEKPAIKTTESKGDFKPKKREVFLKGDKAKKKTLGDTKPKDEC